MTRTKFPAPVLPLRKMNRPTLPYRETELSLPSLEKAILNYGCPSWVVIWKGVLKIMNMKKILWRKRFVLLT